MPRPSISPNPEDDHARARPDPPRHRRRGGRPRPRFPRPKPHRRGGADRSSGNRRPRRRARLPNAGAWRTGLGRGAPGSLGRGVPPLRRQAAAHPCSAEALRKRALRDGGLPSIDPVVDLYNAISVQFAIPVGGENLAAYAGTPRLVVADGSRDLRHPEERRGGRRIPDPGEVVWRDDLGVTCRRWNWRQGVRTRLDASARRMWFILESLPEMPLAALAIAPECASASAWLLRRIAPDPGCAGNGARRPRASPAAAGTGARACAPAWMPAPGACGSSSRACRKCRWRPHEAGGLLLDELRLMMPGMRADSRLLCVATEPTDSV